MMLITRNDLANTRPVIGQMLLGFSFRSLGALLLMDPEWIPIPKRKGDIARRVTAAWTIFRTVFGQYEKYCNVVMGTDDSCRR